MLKSFSCRSRHHLFFSSLAIAALFVAGARENLLRLYEKKNSFPAKNVL